MIYLQYDMNPNIIRHSVYQHHYIYLSSKQVQPNDNLQYLASNILSFILRPISLQEEDSLFK